MKPGVKRAHYINPAFSLTYALLLGAALVVELVGVKRKGSGDTITENWHWLDAHMHGPFAWLFHVFTGGACVWVCLHFLTGIT